MLLKVAIIRNVLFEGCLIQSVNVPSMINGIDSGWNLKLWSCCIILLNHHWVHYLIDLNRRINLVFWLFLRIGLNCSKYGIHVRVSMLLVLTPLEWWNSPLMLSSSGILIILLLMLKMIVVFALAIITSSSSSVHLGNFEALNPIYVIILFSMALHILFGSRLLVVISVFKLLLIALWWLHLHFNGL